MQAKPDRGEDGERRDVCGVLEVSHNSANGRREARIADSLMMNAVKVDQVVGVIRNSTRIIGTIVQL